MRIYAGTAVVAFSMLVLEIALTRLLSVVTWYHLAFFAVSTAMLGMTAGATFVYLRPEGFKGARVEAGIARACMGFALTIPVSLVILCLTPLNLPTTPMGYAALLQATIACALPFVFSGVAITAVLTRIDKPIGKLYASDLLGASLGCLFVLGGLEIMNAPNLILACAPCAALGGLCFCWQDHPGGLRRRMLAVAAGLFLLVVADASLPLGIAPVVVKGSIENPESNLLERWNSFSRVIVKLGSVVRPQYWGPSPKAPVDLELPQYRMNIDGEAATTVTEFRSPGDLDYLRYDVTNLAYFLRSSGGACIIGVGGGRDIQSALAFGQEQVVGIDVNPIFIDLLRRQFRDFAGIAGRDDVSLVVDDARSYLARTTGSYAVVQMSLIDTWAATGAGAFALSENALYTTEAWATILDDLASDGIFTVSRWYDPESLGETGRMLSLAVATLLEVGVSNPSQHIAMATSGRVSTLILGREPLSWIDIMRLRRVCSELEYGLPVLPGAAPVDPTLRAIIASRSVDQLRAATTGSDFNYTPPTDDNPYFFNMLRLHRISREQWSSEGVLRGNMIATLTLAGLIVCLLILAAATIVVPLLVENRTSGSRFERLDWSGAAYFSLIGAGFMFVEIALIQRLSVFLGHPVYALGVLLLTIIASAGVGSLLSERLPLTRPPWVFVYPVAVAVLVLATRFLLPVMSSQMASAGMLAKVAVAVAAITPVGLLLGVCFPTGMRLVAGSQRGETPWYWALNGVFGVLSSALAVFVSISWGISMSLYIGSVCYILLLVCIPGMTRVGRRALQPSTDQPGARQPTGRALDAG